MDTNGGGKPDSAIRTIVVAVLIALIAGGSAPWWWGKLFPPPVPHVDQKNPPPYGIGACASGDSPKTRLEGLGFHNAPASNGSWDWDCDGQIEREWGPCENLTRVQCDPNTNETGAPPGFCTELRTEGGCLPRL